MNTSTRKKWCAYRTHINNQLPERLISCLCVKVPYRIINCCRREGYNTFLRTNPQEIIILSMLLVGLRENRLTNAAVGRQQDLPMSFPYSKTAFRGPCLPHGLPLPGSRCKPYEEWHRGDGVDHNLKVPTMSFPRPNLSTRVRKGPNELSGRGIWTNR